MQVSPLMLALTAGKKLKIDDRFRRCVMKQAQPQLIPLTYRFALSYSGVCIKHADFFIPKTCCFQTENDDIVIDVFFFLYFFSDTRVFVHMKRSHFR